MLFYTALNFVRPAISILLIPIYLSVFTEEEWAIYSLMLVVLGFTLIIMCLRIGIAMLTHYYDHYHDRDELKRYLSTSFTSSLGVGILFLVIAYFTGEAIFQMVFESDKILFFPYGFTICLYAVISEANLCYFNYLKNEKNLRGYASVVLTQILLVILFQFLLIVIYRQGVQGALIGLLAANVFTFCHILYLERNIITFQIDKGMLKKSLRFSIPLIPYMLIYLFMTKGERILLEQFLDLALVGKYILLATFTGVTILLIEAVINGVRPFLFEIFSKKEDSREGTVPLLTKMIVNVPLLALPVIILIGNNLQLITSNQEYYLIAPYVVTGSLAAYSLVYSKMFYQQLVFKKKSVTATYLSIISLGVFLGALFYLIPRYEIWGVLYAVFIVNISLAVLFFIAGQKAIHVEYHFKDIILNPLICAVFILGLESLMMANGIERSSFAWIQFCLFTLLILALNYTSIKDYKAIFVHR